MIRAPRFLAAAAVGLLLVLAGCAAPRSHTAIDEHQVAAVDDACVVAEVAYDEAAMRRMIDERFVFNEADGTTVDKEGFVQRVLKLPMVGQTIRDRTILIEGDTALVFATTELRFARVGQPESVNTLRYTCVYVRRDGRWRMLALQMQPLTK